MTGSDAGPAGHELGRLFEEIDAVPSLPALWSLMVRHFRAAGFEAMAYVLFDRGRLGRSVAIFEYGFPAEVVERFALMGHGRDSPLMRIAMASGKVQVSSEAFSRYRLSQRETAHSNAIVASGLSEPIAVPLYGSMGRDAFGVLAKPRVADPFHLATRTALHAAAQAAHLKAFELQRNPDLFDHSLSEREVEILRWVAQGKSNSVIADILEIAPATVDTYLRRIFEKLEVADRTAAAVKGVSIGVIRA